MNIKNSDIDVGKAIEFSQLDDLLLKRRNNRMLLSNYQIQILENNNIDYSKYCNYYDLLFDVEEMLDDNFDSELDIVSSQIADYIYYNQTKK